jgi:hypothetical protein
MASMENLIESFMGISMISFTTIVFKVIVSLFFPLYSGLLSFYSIDHKT